MSFNLKYSLTSILIALIATRVFVCDEIFEPEETLFFSTLPLQNTTLYMEELKTDYSRIADPSKKYEGKLVNNPKIPDSLIIKRNLTVNPVAVSNVTDQWNATDNPTECPVNLVLPAKGIGEEVNHSLKILLMLFVIAVCFLQIYFLLRSKFHYLPESSVIVLTGAVFAAFFEAFSGHLPGDFKKKEAFDPTTFFLFLLPPIMYESAYNLHKISVITISMKNGLGQEFAVLFLNFSLQNVEKHEAKGNFFRNFGSIMFFSVFGTAISAFVIGGSIFLLGQLKLVYELTFTESFAYGSFLSAVDPVATLAVFQALDIDPILSMLVTGESILNDAVAIVLASTVWEASKNGDSDQYSISYILLQCAIHFSTIFLTSALVGLLSGFLAALVFKHVGLRKYPWMEFGMMLIFIYTPYCVAEVLQISAIVTILFNGIVMSHYTHLNLSKLVQNIMQVTLRSMAFIAETCVFAYLGVSIFSYHIMLDLPFVFASIFLCLIARALNIIPLSFIVNLFREHEITPRMMFIMWFSAIRGAVSFALALRFEFEEKKRNVIVTATLVIVLFTTVIFGGGTMPLFKFLQKKEEKRSLEREICPSEVCLIKTEKMGETIDAEQLSDVEEMDLLGARNFFLQMDAKYLTPFFTRNKNLSYGSDVESKTSEDFPKEWYSSVQKTGNESP